MTWCDKYCQQHDGILKIKYIFQLQNTRSKYQKMNDSINSKSKASHPTNIWNDNINNEINDWSCTISITNIINIEQHDLWFDFVIQSWNGSNRKSQIIEDENFIKLSYSMMVEEFKYCKLDKQLNAKKKTNIYWNYALKKLCPNTLICLFSN